MNEELKEGFEVETKKRLDELSDMDLNSKEYLTALNNVSKLVENTTKLNQQELDYKFKICSKSDDITIAQEELKLKNKQAKVDMWHKVAMVGVAVGGALLTAAINVWGTKTCLNYDADGNIVTTKPGQKFTDRLFKS